MIGLCLVKDPRKRPTAKKLLKHPFFKQARSLEYINKKMLDGLPMLGDQYQALKVNKFYRDFCIPNKLLS
jgi:serine/threonine-protein kinase OSR1/STK39